MTNPQPGMRLAYITVGDAPGNLGHARFMDYLNAVGYALNAAMHASDPQPDGVWWGRWYQGQGAPYDSACMCVQFFTPAAEYAAWEALSGLAQEFGQPVVWADGQILGTPGYGDDRDQPQPPKGWSTPQLRRIWPGTVDSAAPPALPVGPSGPIGSDPAEPGELAMTEAASAFVPVIRGDARLWVHNPGGCGHTEWWPAEAAYDPGVDEGCDACQSGTGEGGWQPVYVPAAGQPPLPELLRQVLDLVDLSVAHVSDEQVEAALQRVLAEHAAGRKGEPGGRAETERH